MKLIRNLVIAGGVLALAASAQAQESYRIGGGPSGGAWHPALSAGTTLWNEELSEKYEFVYTPSEGSVENVRRIASGEFDSAWGHVGQVFQAWNGTGLFEMDGPSKDFRIIANVRKQSQIIAVLDDSPIKSYSDMEGHVVNLLVRGSGSNVNCENIVDAIGLRGKVEERHLGFGEGARALGDRQVDVYCSAGVPHTIPGLTEIAIRNPVRYISMTEEEQKQVVEEFPFYTPYTIPALPDIPNVTEPTRTISYDVWWLVSDNMSDEAVYDHLSTAAEPENLEKLSAAAAFWKDLSGDFSAVSNVGVPVHPAAARFWREQGVDVPDDVVEGF